ncbi:MAG: hypothetical protein ACM3RX_00220 [Methanococcaceae archaeon]
MKGRLILSCLLCFFTDITFAQLGTDVLTVLRLSPSPFLSSYGSAGTSAPVSDAYSFYYNPAQLGLFPVHNNFTFGSYPETRYFFNMPELTISSTVISAGWKFKNSMMPFRLGLGYMRTSMHGLTSAIDDNAGVSPTNDSYNAFALGLGFDYFISFNLGITYKSINSAIPEIPGLITESRIVERETSVSALDYGVLISAPLFKLLNNSLEYEHYKACRIIPFLDLSVGYALRNSGSEISYNFGRSYPIGRTASIGYTISTGAEYELQPGNSIRAFEVDFSTEAEDLLERTANDPATYIESCSYKGLIGDINIWKNLVLGKWNNDILRHRGIRIELAEVFQYNWGSLQGNEYHLGTKGWGIRTKGLLKALKPTSSIIAFLADHFDVQYFYTANSSNLFTELSSISLTVNGLENLF